MSSSPSINDFNELLNRIIATRTSDDNILFLRIQGGDLFSTTDHTISVHLKDLNARISQFISNFVKMDHGGPKVTREYRLLAQHFRTYARLEYSRDKKHFPEITSKTIQYFVEITREKESSLSPNSSSPKFYTLTCKVTNLITFDEEGKRATSQRKAISHTVAYSEKNRIFDDDEEKDEYFLEKLHEQMNSLTNIKNHHSVGIQDITNAFIEQVSLKMNSEKREIVLNPTYLAFTIQKVLNQLTDDVESGKIEKVTLQIFIENLVTALYDDNNSSEEIDRMSFYFLTKKVQGKSSRPLAGLYPNLKSLQDEFDNGRWRENETRLLEHLETNEFTLDCYSKVIEKFKSNHDLKIILNHYFDSLQKPFSSKD